MGSVQTMMGAGVPGAQAVAIGSGTVAATVSAAGTTNADATQLSADFNVVTTAATNSGVKLPDAEVGSQIIVINGGAGTALKVYPGTGLQMNNDTATTGFVTLGIKKAGIFIRGSFGHWAGIGDVA